MAPLVLVRMVPLWTDPYLPNDLKSVHDCLQVPSPTASPGRRSRSKVREGFLAGDDAAAVAAAAAATGMVDAVAAEVGLEGDDRDALRPFEPVALVEVIHHCTCSSSAAVTQQ